MTSHSIKKLIKEEVKKLLMKEYFHVTRDNRQLEVQQFLSQRVEREDLREFLRNPGLGRKYIRENHTEKFYWWADCDIDNLFKNWR